MTSADGILAGGGLAIWPQALAGAAALLALAGCGPSRPPRVPVPPFSPAAVADAALAAGPLESLPAIAGARASFDTDGDGSVSRGELVAWLQRIRDSKVAITQLDLRLTHRGKPLTSAVVRLVPEPCMGDGIRAATGQTDDAGSALLTIPGGSHPGVNCGLYRVEVEGQGNDGQPLPARFNTDSQLGLAVGAGLPLEGSTAWTLE